MAKYKAVVEDKSPVVFQKSKIKESLTIKELNWTDKQKGIIETCLDKKAKLTFIDGIFGSGKTLLAVYLCLKLLQEKKISNILYIRNAVQSGSGTLGWLPGEISTRLGPYMAPLQQKLDELLPSSQVEYLVKNKIVETQAVALLRGASYNAYGIIIDEAGCMTKEDLLLTLSRVGEFSRVFCIGDSWQTDVKNSGFKEIFNIFSDDESKENGVFTYELKEELDVVRSKLLKFIMKKVRGYK